MADIEASRHRFVFILHTRLVFYIIFQFVRGLIGHSLYFGTFPIVLRPPFCVLLMSCSLECIPREEKLGFNFPLICQTFA